MLTVLAEGSFQMAWAKGHKMNSGILWGEDMGVWSLLPQFLQALGGIQQSAVKTAQNAMSLEAALGTLGYVATVQLASVDTALGCVDTTWLQLGSSLNRCNHRSVNTQRWCSALSLITILVQFLQVTKMWDCYVFIYGYWCIIILWILYVTRSVR